MKRLLLIALLLGGASFAHSALKVGGGGGGGDAGPGVGDIEGVTAGDGLSGGGTSGTPTISLDASGISTNYIPRYDGTKLANSELYYASSIIGGGNGLGFNTTLPLYALHIENATAAPKLYLKSLTASGGFPGLIIGSSDTAFVGGFVADIANHDFLIYDYGGETAATIEENGDVTWAGTVTATAFVGDGSLLTGVSGSGDVVKSATQTFTGGNTFNSWTTFNGSITVAGSGIPTVSATGGNIGLSPVSGSTYTVHPSSFIAPNGYNILHATIPFNVSVASGVGFNGLSIPLGGLSAQGQATITQIDAVSLPSGTSVLWQLDERTLAGVGSAGTDVMTVSYATATSPGATYLPAAMSNTTIAQGSQLVLKTHPTAAAGGSAAYLSLTIWYKEQ